MRARNGEALSMNSREECSSIVSKSHNTSMASTDLTALTDDAFCDDVRASLGFDNPMFEVKTMENMSDIESGVATDNAFSSDGAASDRSKSSNRSKKQMSGNLRHQEQFHGVRETIKSCQNNKLGNIFAKDGTGNVSDDPHRDSDDDSETQTEEKQ